MIRCEVAFGSRVRPCLLETLEDEEATQVWLRCETNGRRALLPVGVAQISEALKQQCLVALSDSQAVPGESLGQRMGRRAAESPEMVNARLWIERQQALQMLSRGAKSGGLGYCYGRGYGK